MDPEFRSVLSRPGIFLVRMGVFLILAGLIAGILHKQIVAAFWSNPGLNLLILGVLLIGILFFLRQIVRLYDLLLQITPSPIIELNRAVAVAMRDGLEAGLALIDDILANSELGNYHLAHSARAELCRRLGRTAEARASYQKALALAQQEPERRLLERQLENLPD